MSLQEIEVTNVQSATEGVKRTLADGSLGLILDTLQITQYVMPIESTVRELASNAVDSQKEKMTAIKILKGEVKPEEIFIKREGEKYKDSQWDPSYYDLKHLNLEKNNVLLEYKQNPGMGFSDQFSVTDYGVGLGMPRLEGYFQLGYSTKRNAKEMLGAFGFGNKVALSTRCDFYELETVHNGKKFRFNCGSHKVDPLIPKLNMEKGIANNYVIFNEGKYEEKEDGTKVSTEVKIYYEDTDEMNYTKVIVPVKRINREKFRNAVRNQLMYFDNIDFHIIDESGYKENVHIKSRILHSSKHLLISDTYIYNKPHVVIVKDNSETSTTGVCYGYINFEELEMQNMYGPIGFKCPIRSVVRDEKTGQETVIQEGVSVTPSRESVIWDEHTKDYITKVIEGAKEEANKIVTESLKEDNIAKWLIKAEAILHSTGSRHGNPALYNLSKIIDTQTLKPRFGKDKIPYYSPGMFLPGSESYKKLSTRNEYKDGKNMIRITRSDSQSWANMEECTLLLKRADERFNYSRDRYLVHIHGENQVVVLSEPSREALEKAYDKFDGKVKTPKNVWVDKKYNRSKILWDTLIEDGKDFYTDVKIPEDWESKLEKEEKEIESSDFKATLSAKDYRELNGFTLIHGLEYVRNLPWRPPTFDSETGTSLEKRFTAKKFEVKPIDLTNYQGELYYGFTEDYEDLHMAGLIVTEAGTKQSNGNTGYYDSFNTWSDCKSNDSLPVIIKVNKSMKKFLDKSGHRHISEFYWREDSKGNTELSDIMKNYMTAAKIHEDLDKLKFLSGFKHINPEVYEIYKEVRQFTNRHYGSVHQINHHKAYSVMNKLADLDIYAREHTDAESIKSKTLELLGYDTEGVTSGINFDIWDKFLILQEYSEGIVELLSHVDILTSGGSLSSELMSSVEEYLMFKHKSNFKINLDDNN